MIGECVYLDWNATPPLRANARDAVVSALALVGNPSSVHGEGRAARAAIDRARQQVAALVGATPAHVVFTSGATEAASHVLTPDFRMGRSPLAVTHLYAGATEHPCVLAGGRFGGERLVRVPVVENGIIDFEALGRSLDEHEFGLGLPMVALQLANNETGVIQPIAEVSALVKAHRGILVVDVVQAAGRIPISMEGLGADFLILSSHKIGGPKGAGALVSAGEVMMPSPLVTGGGQEAGHRSGTENIAAIAGFGAAAEGALAELDAYQATVGAVRDRIEVVMRAEAPDIVIHGEGAPRIANTTFFSLPGLKGETAQIAFDLEGVALSAGSACSSGKVGPSHVLEAMGFDAALGAVRVSIGSATTAEEVGRFIEVFTRINRRRTARSAAAA